MFKKLYCDVAEFLSKSFLMLKVSVNEIADTPLRTPNFQKREIIHSS